MLDTTPHWKQIEIILEHCGNEPFVKQFSFGAVQFFGNGTYTKL